jgi:metal-responsive CopG/Arc/MetJ family transcriptional regulator
MTARNRSFFVQDTLIVSQYADEANCVHVLDFKGKSGKLQTFARKISTST